MIEEMPEVEAELVRLNRDYDVIRDRYQALLNSLERENLSQQVLESEEMEFRIIQPPSANAEPVAPRRGLMMSFVFVFSLGSGVLAAYFFSQLTPVFNRASDLQSGVSFPVIGQIGELGQDTIRCDYPFLTSITALFCLLLIAVIVETYGSGVATLF